MAKPKKNDQPEFSANHVLTFLDWLKRQPEAMQSALLSDKRFVIRSLRAVAAGRSPEDGGGTMKPLYGVP